jgi:YegS/Rv2252/BmrU family lipid kinase
MNIFLILNPTAGRYKGTKAIQKAAPLLENRGIQCEVRVSKFPGHAVQLAQNFDHAKYEGIVAVGGDGTLFEVLNGVLKKTHHFDLPIGQIPVGTGNSFIKDLGIHSIEDAVDKIAGGKTKKVDVGFFQYPGGENYFINLLGTGFVANVAHRAGKYKSLGSLSYVLGVFEEVARLKPVPLEMTIDGNVYHRDYIFTEICNSTKTGGNMIMAPDAKIDDGFLDIILLNDISKYNLLKVFPQIFKGTHIHDSHAEIFKGREIKIVTETPQRLTPDGEILGTTAIKVSIFPSHINMFC